MEALRANDPVTVGRYRLLGRLGAGGMGLVYLGAAAAGRQVAIKVVHPGFAHDDEFRARFAREVAVSRKVTGPWTAAVVDADPTADTPWLATEYVPGPSLDRQIRTSGPLVPRAVHAIAVGLARALVAIHGAGLIHRDVKPSNVLLAADGPRLIDFGISRAIDGTRMTSTGMVIGTPAFMSPEQTEGNDIGPESDVFSLGAVLVMAASGVGPFGEGTPMVLLRRVLTAKPDLGALAEPVRGVVAECLRLDRAERPTAKQLVERLEAVAPPRTRKGTAVLPAETKVAEPETRSGPSRRSLLVGAGALVAAVVGIPLLDSIVGKPSLRTPRWTFDARTPIAGLVATDATVYVAHGEIVTAVDASTGQTRWSRPLKSSIIRMFASEVGVVVWNYYGSSALDGATGSTRWDTNDELLAVVDRRVMIGVRANALVARDITTGAEQWSRPTSDDDRWVSAPGTSATTSAGAAHLFSRARLDTIDAGTGELRWSRPLRPATPNPSPAVVRGVLPVVERLDNGDQLLALDATSGSERWRQPCHQLSSIAMDEQSIYLASWSGGVTAHCRDSGEQRWSSPFGASLAGQRSIATVPNGPVIVGANTEKVGLTALKDGRVSWTFEGDGVEPADRLHGPVIAGRSAMVGIGSKVYAVALD